MYSRSPAHKLVPDLSNFSGDSGNHMGLHHRINEPTDFNPIHVPAIPLLGEAVGGDVFALARIAGHSSVTITQRYIHPQGETIDRVFSKAQQPQRDARKQGRKRKPRQRALGTNLGTLKNRKNLQLTSGS
jgi:hypothetical protein